MKILKMTTGKMTLLLIIYSFVNLQLLILVTKVSAFQFPTSGIKQVCCSRVSSSSGVATTKALQKASTDIFSQVDVDSRNPSNQSGSPVVGFINAIENNDIDLAMTYVIKDDDDGDNAQDEFHFENTNYPNSWKSSRELERILRLRSNSMKTKKSTRKIVIDHSIYDPSAKKAGLAFHVEHESPSNNVKGAAFFYLDSYGLIYKSFIVKENDKSGESSLKLLKLASQIISLTSKNTSSTDDVGLSTQSQSPPPPSSTTAAMTLPEIYFNGWNQRDMKKAVAVFSENVVYDDTAFPTPFRGKRSLLKHLNVCAEAMPSSFRFVVDDQIDAGDKLMVLWHVENKSEELPYTRGCSYYMIEDGKISSGTDLKEPAVFKTGGTSLFLRSLISNVKEEPVRAVPIVVWLLYCYIVFFSDFFYGMPAQSFEVRTWEEVRDLSFNFFLISPAILKIGPVVHPGLEGIFNLLLSWAALFAGFLSDDRKRKPNIFPMVPTVIGMQFLTSAFLLPYLATRESEPSEEANQSLSKDDVSTFTRAVAESKLYPIGLCGVGVASILWGLFGRSQFGDLSTRYLSLIELLRIDRVGSSFLVDLLIFWLFQGWLIDDDAKRRGLEKSSPSVYFGKFLPFFGLVVYLVSRPTLPLSNNSGNNKKL